MANIGCSALRREVFVVTSINDQFLTLTIEVKFFFRYARAHCNASFLQIRVCTNHVNPYMSITAPCAMLGAGAHYSNDLLPICYQITSERVGSGEVLIILGEHHSNKIRLEGGTLS
jgi:hypothetical protein